MATPSDARALPHRAHQRLIGILGFLLPPLLFVLAAARPTPPLSRWELLRSISAYYYTGAVALFVGTLFALALFLISYPGYDGVEADRILARVAGTCALAVALCPTTAPTGLSEASWWRPELRVIHLGAAITLFSCFAVFCLWLFRKSSIPDKSKRPPDKKRRDHVYLLCGILIVASMAWALSSKITGASVFWPETIALWAFGFSWLVKGEAIDLGPGTGKRA